MATNVDINGGNECVVPAVGTTEAGKYRKKVIIAGIGGSATVTLGSSTVAIAVPAGTFLDLGAFQGKIVTANSARAIIIS